MKVTVITTTFNSEATIETCVASVNTQKYSDIEHIIIDGASTDDTLRIIEKIPNRITKIVSENDKGIYDAINKGIKIASGDIIGILNSDDVYFNNNSVKQIVTAFETRKTDCVYGNLVYINKQDQVVRTWKSQSFRPGLFAKSWTPAHPTFYCKRDIYEKFGVYKTDYKIAADVELMLRFLEVHQIKSTFLDEFLVSMRMGGASTKGIQSTITITREVKRAFEENNLSFNLPIYLVHKFMKVKELFNIEERTRSKMPV